MEKKELSNISSEINLVDSHLIGRVIKDILKISQERYKDTSHDFVKELKKGIDKKYLEEMEYIGVNNLNILEMRKI